MNNIMDFQACANCGACYNICPKDAIFVQEEGLFYTPVVDEKKCVQCGLCKQVCPVNQSIPHGKPLQAYGIIHHNEEVLQKSSSGGAFSALAENVLAQGGVVFGAAYTDDFQSVELCSTESCTLNDLRKSKYVESKPGYSFREVKRLLEEGRQVLFCGAPCQIAGLHTYLGKEYAGLLTCDFSCGGMPSHQLYRQWLAGLETRLNGKLSSLDFRSKAYGWSNITVEARAENGKLYRQSYLDDPYYHCFMNTLVSMREYCYTCKFAREHAADLILADFWKYKSISNIRNNNKGISLVIANSLKGEQAIRAIGKNVALTTVELEPAMYNLQERIPPKERLERRRNFLRKCEEADFYTAVKPMALKHAVKFKTKYIIKKLLGRG